MSLENQQNRFDDVHKISDANAVVRMGAVESHSFRPQRLENFLTSFVNPDVAIVGFVKFVGVDGLKKPCALASSQPELDLLVGTGLVKNFDNESDLLVCEHGPHCTTCNLPAMSRFLVYGLIDPFSQEIRYVGKSCSGLARPVAHWNTSSLRDKTRKCAWVKSVLARGVVPEVVVLEAFQSAAELSEAEQFWIAAFRMVGANLTNATNGGDGCSGRRHSEQTRLKIGASQKNKIITQSHRKKLSESRGITDAIEREVCAGFASVGVLALSRKLGISKRTVYLILRRHGVSTKSGRSNGIPPPAALVLEACNLRQQGLTFSQIAQKMGRKKSTIYLWCNRKTHEQSTLPHVQAAYPRRRSEPDHA